MIHFTTGLIFLSSCVSLLGAKSTDIVVQDKTVMQRCQINGPSTRMIAVGNPGGYNYAFDALHCAPVYTWSGGFIDFKGEVRGRGGSPCKILGIPQNLGTDKVPFRVSAADTAPEAVKFHGYRRDAKTGAPTFLFAIDGFNVEQSVQYTSPNTVVLNFNFPKKGSGNNYYLIDSKEFSKVDLSDGLSWKGDKAIEIPAATTSASVTLHLKPLTKKFVRKTNTMSGKQIYNLHCNACHSLDGTKIIGPSFKSIWGKTHTVIRNGEEKQIKVDAKYLIESITKPQAAVVKGYESLPMPSFAKVLSKKEIEALVKYISKL